MQDGTYVVSVKDNQLTSQPIEVNQYLQAFQPHITAFQIGALIESGILVLVLCAFILRRINKF